MIAELIAQTVAVLTEGIGKPRSTIEASADFPKLVGSRQCAVPCVLPVASYDGDGRSTPNVRHDNRHPTSFVMQRSDGARGNRLCMVAALTSRQ